jgi:hypothetical protein
MKALDFHYMPGDLCWVRGENRVCYIENITIERGEHGELEATYTWYNLEYGVDVTEVWADGYFMEKDIGKTVFDTYEEYYKAFPEDFDYPEGEF